MTGFFNNRAHIVKAPSNSPKRLKLCIASLNIEIDCLYGNSFYDVKDYYTEFETPDIRIGITQDEIDNERLMHPEVSEPNIEVDDIRVGLTYNHGWLEPIIALNKIADAIVPFDTFLMHGAVIARDNNAYIITAPSGTGKTTRANIWVNTIHGSEIINGDKPFIRVTEDCVLVSGTPWCGKERQQINKMVPLKAIFMLERADIDDVEEISLGKAFPLLLKQIHCPIDREKMLHTIQLIKTLEGRVKFYRFRSTPSPESVRLAYEKASQ